MTDAPVLDTTPQAAAPAAGDVLSSLTAEERGAWLKTGALPGDESAADPEPAPAEPAKAAPGETRPPSPRRDINARLGQLSEQKHAADARAEAAERRAADLEARLAATSTAAPASTAPPATAAPAPALRVYQTPRGPVDFASDDPSVIVDQFIALGYVDPYAAMNLFTAKAALHFAESDRQTAATQARDKALVDDAFHEVHEKYPDWSIEKLKTPEMQYPVPMTTARLIFESPVRADVIYYFSEHPAEGRKIAAMDPLAAARALGALESTLSAAPSSAVTRKTVSSAPAPSQTLGSRHQSGAGDELDDAVKTNDVARYMEIANRRDLEARRGSRR